MLDEQAFIMDRGDGDGVGTGLDGGTPGHNEGGSRFPLTFISSKRDDQCNHNPKKRKDSLETRAEPAVLWAYVENQAILQPILLYRASKRKQTQKHGSKAIYRPNF